MKVADVATALLVAASNKAIKDPPLLANLTVVKTGAGLGVAELIKLNGTEILDQYWEALLPLVTSCTRKEPLKVEGADNTNRPVNKLAVDANVKLDRVAVIIDAIVPFVKYTIGVIVTESPGAADKEYVKTYWLGLVFAPYREISP